MADGRTRLRKAEDEIAELKAEVEALRAAQNVHLGHGHIPSGGHCCGHGWHSCCGNLHWNGCGYPSYPHYPTVTWTSTPTVSSGTAYYGNTVTSGSSGITITN